MSSRSHIYCNATSDLHTTKTPYWTGPLRVYQDGELVVPETLGYDVYYSTDPIQNGNLQGNYESDFTLREGDITDWSKVTMFKIRMREPAVINVKGEPDNKIMFVNPANTPSDMTLETDNEKSVSTFSITTGIMRETQEPSYLDQREVAPVIAPYINYKVTGTLYRDFNFSGKMNTTEKRFENIKVGLYDENGDLLQETTTNSIGGYEFEVSRRGNYQVRLLETPDTYSLYDANAVPTNIFPNYPKSGNEARVNFRSVGHDVDANGYSQLLPLNPANREQVIDMAFVEALESISVEKQWLISPGATTSVRLELRADGQSLPLTVTSQNGWQGAFVNVRKRDAKELAYQYQVVEILPTGALYQFFSERTDTGFIVKNFDSETIDIPVTKEWKGEPTSSVTIVLYNGDTEVDRAELTAANNYQHTFTVPKRDGKQYPNDAVYRIEEIAPSKYSHTITGNQTDGFVVTNTNNELLTIPVTKVWNGQIGGDVTVNLLRDGAVVESKTLTVANGYSGEFTVRRFNEETGEAYSYALEEQTLAGYESTITGSMYSGFTVTNQEVISFNATKEWIGGSQAHPPVSIELYRQVDGSDQKEVVEERVLNAENQWTTRFENLPRTTTDGRLVYTYGVEESSAIDYFTSQVEGSDTTGFTIRNISQETIPLTIRKVWVGKTGDQAVVRLLRNGEAIGESIVLTKDTGWTHELTNLPKYDAVTGEAYVYTIAEEEQDHYSSRIEGNIEAGFTVINTFGAYQVKFVKVDAADSSVRLSGVVFRLSQNGEEKYTATSNANGEVLFTNVVPGEYILEEVSSIEGYLPDRTQKTVVVDGESEVMELENWTNTKITGSITLTKVDAETQNVLEGVVFALKKENVEIARGTTDTTGQVTFANIPYGSYTVEEVSAKEGYQHSSVTYPATIQTNGQVVNLGEIENQPIKGAVYVYKVAPAIVNGEETTDTFPVEGVTFGLFKLQTDEVVAQAITDKNGVAKFENILYGQYEVREVAVPRGYTINEEVRTVQIVNQGDIVVLSKENDQHFVNQWIKGHVQFVKVNSETGEVIAGVKFGLFHVNESHQATLVQEAYSTEDGIVRFENVPFGPYRIEELETIEGFNLSAEKRPVFVLENLETIELAPFENRPIRGHVSFVKKDGDTGSVLAGVVFVLTDGAKEVARAVSDATGKVIFSNVLYGDYTLQEMSALEGYTLSSEVRMVSITEDGKEEILPDFINKKITATIRLMKVDEMGQPLPGATFALVSNGEKIKTALSDEQGFVTFERVAYGDYEVMEVEAPEGYEMNATALFVQVREEGATIVLESVVNRKVIPSPSEEPDSSKEEDREENDTSHQLLPNTGSTQATAIWASMALVMGCVVTIANIKKRNEQSAA